MFSIRFEALFPCAGALGCVVCFAPCCLSRFICAQVWGPRALPAALPAPFSTTLSPALSVYFCANVGLQGLLVVRLAAPFIPHSTSLVPPQQPESSPSQCPSPPLLPVWMNVYFFISLVSDFLAVGFSVSSGCARRHSVSTYAAILVLKFYVFFNAC